MVPGSRGIEGWYGRGDERFMASGHPAIRCSPPAIMRDIPQERYGTQHVDQGPAYARDRSGMLWSGWLAIPALQFLVCCAKTPRRQIT